MEDIRVPMRQGSIDDITEGDAVDGSQDTPMDSMNSQGAKAIYEREAALEIDYSLLSEEYKEVS
jgi:hypothetical protein